MPTRGVRLWWVPGVGVILVGCFFLAMGIAARLRDSVGVVELVDGVVIAGICFLAGGVMLRRHAEDARLARRYNDRPRTDTPPGGVEK